MLKLQYNAQVMHQENRDNRVGVVGNTRTDNNSYQFRAVYFTCLLKGQVFHEMKSLNWLILLRIYLVWLSYSYCFIFDYNYSSFALRLQTSQHLILDLLYLKQ